MSWKELCAMDQKIQMIGDWTSDQYSITELSQIYFVSRKTVYKWIERYRKKLPRDLMICRGHLLDILMPLRRM